MPQQIESRDLTDLAAVDSWLEANAKSNPAQFWLELNRRNIEQLREQGYDNFKRTVALNYFTWIIGFRDEQFSFLKRHLPRTTVVKCFLKSVFSKKFSLFTRKKSVQCKFLTYLLYEYVLNKYSVAFFMGIQEPLEGNPPVVFAQKRSVSQDLINSILEYNSIINSGINPDGLNVIMELGAGYGRNAFVFSKALSKSKYIIVDIFPALYVSWRYLSNQFPGRKIFQPRQFDDFLHVKTEFEEANLVFLLPHQLRLLPDRSVDLFVNISSFQEMIRAQVDWYFQEVERLVKGYFYFKQWKESRIPSDNILIKESDYPIRKGWTKIFSRECEIQTRFFEALYKL
jgi:putative sugar O-methyltransferase